MKTAPRFLIAKYVEDIQRMEPRNIGVILWADGLVSARFLGEDKAGSIVSKPAFIRQRNLPVYGEWVTYWRKKIDEAGELRNRADFLDALLNRSRENYILVDGGIVPSPIQPERLNDAVQQLFAQLVDDQEEREDFPSRVLDQKCRHFLERSGLRKVDNFRESYEVRIDFHDVQRVFQFSYGVGPGGGIGLPGMGPEALFQKTLVRNDKDVSSAMFLMGRVTNPRHVILPKNRCASLVNVTDEELTYPRIADTLKMLGKVSTIVNVANDDDALTAYRTMNVSGNGHSFGEPPF